MKEVQIKKVNRMLNISVSVDGKAVLIKKRFTRIFLYGGEMFGVFKMYKHSTYFDMCHLKSGLPFISLPYKQDALISKAVSLFRNNPEKFRENIEIANGRPIANDILTLEKILDK